VQLIRRAGQNLALLDKACPIIERQLEQMVRLVDDLLDVSRITRDKLELRKERVELASVVCSAVETSSPVIEGAAHELTVSLPPEPIPLYADPVRLAQAFSNLLSNAAKYTEPGGRIWLNAEVKSEAPDSPGEVVVRVRDTGVGIAADKLPHIFEMFAQLDPSLQRSQGGLGIGLTLTRRFVEMHGGTLVASSDGPGKGSEFVVRLPAAISAATTGDDGGRATDPGERSRRRILVVDDNRDFAVMLAAMLELLGHTVTTAHDGFDAVANVQSIRPHIAFLDLGMPKMSGYEAARRIRERPWGQSVALVAVTGWGHDADKRRSREAGFDAHLVKPVDIAAIEGLLDTITGRATCG
jgi:CheY-like chemotaxis protein/two-component sensor histidine kinase